MKQWKLPLLALLLTACTSGVTPTATVEVALPVAPQGPPATAAVTKTVEVAIPIAPQGPAATRTPEMAEGQPTERRLTIPAADDLALAATLYSPSGAPGPWPGVLLVHMLGSERGAWAPLASPLVNAGYAVLAIDLRGHGDTGGEVDWEKARDDVQRAWRYLGDLPEVDGERTAVIGASIGANLALVTGAGEPAIRTVILLSPGLDYRGVTTSEAMQAFGERPALIVASQGDTYAAQSSQTLETLAQGETRLELFDGAAHGTQMLEVEPDLADLILNWLDQHLR